MNALTKLLIAAGFGGTLVAGAGLWAAQRIIAATRATV